ncbi:hypothetical protein HPB49_005990 [Dermacentor silvarum]|uniref:Uncharacterized protein n=1 Tax=Dermacentor silvarum TaxID=543639 RepID=A0ACB8C2C3_DERSI|nr:hypothetical protein HPB49_005990 [Dermacentor silvarum]
MASTPPSSLDSQISPPQTRSSYPGASAKRRIANRYDDMREHDLRRLVQAFLLSRFIYSLPYIFLSRTEEDKVNNLIRQAYKSTLSLPASTSMVRLLSMGVQLPYGADGGPSHGPAPPSLPHSAWSRTSLYP